MSEIRLGKRVNINLSNRWLYSFIALGILVIVSIGVYAAFDTVPNPGHSFSELQTCSSQGQILKMDAGGNWVCASDDFQANTDAQTLALSGNTLSITGGNNVDLSSLSGSDFDFGYEVLTMKMDIWERLYCSSGKKVLGGGCMCHEGIFNARGAIYFSRPLPNHDGWECHCQKTSHDDNEVWAICANVA